MYCSQHGCKARTSPSCPLFKVCWRWMLFLMLSIKPKLVLTVPTILCMNTLASMGVHYLPSRSKTTLTVYITHCINSLTSMEDPCLPHRYIVS